MVRRCFAGLFVLALIAGSQGSAQTKATELTAGVLGFSYTTCNGCDGIFIGSTGGAENGVFSGLGGGSVGVGFYIDPGMAIEPSLALSHLSQSGDNLTILSLGAALPFYFDKGWGRKGPYLAPRVTYNSIGGGGESASQFAAGLAFGTKVALNDMAALRLQANFDYGFESSDFSSTTAFGALMGVSVFLK